MFFSATALLLLCTVTFQAASVGDTTDTTYVVALLGQDLYNDIANPDIKYELVITNNAGLSSLTVNITGINGHIDVLHVTDTTQYTLDHMQGLNGSEFSNKSIIVHSKDGFFTLQVFTRRLDHNYVEGFLGIPIERLKVPHQPSTIKMVYNYVVASFCDVGGGYCQLAVAALTDDTTISINLPNNVEEIAICRGKGYFRTGRDRQFTLSKHEALQLETTYDLTGTNIFSFEPIVVFAGSRNVTNGDVVAHTMEQLVPSSHWGREYVVQNLGTNGYGDILKIVSHWYDTKVTMKGFPPFIMKDPYQTVVRRLDKGFSSHIQASHPIQVVQITGLTYATENETSTLSMTVVPSVQNALTKSIKVACNGTAMFYIVEEKPVGKEATTVKEPPVVTNLNVKPKVNGTRMNYTKYMTAVIEVSETTTEISNSDMTKNPVRGVMKCGTAAMPISVLYNMNVTGTIPMEPNYTGGVCYEGKASTTFNTPSGTVIPHTLDLHKEHVLELRVRACGETMLQFIVNVGDMQNSLFLRVTNKQVIVNKCFPLCNTSINVTELNDYNKFHTGEWDCKADMAFFWFLQTKANDTNYFCFGIGKYDESICQNAETNQFFQVTSIFTKVRMMAVASDAAFTWDFVHTGGCDSYESDWRCFDRWTNCSSYGTKFCKNDKFSSFANSKCAKFCGKCFADSYGRKFILKLPYVDKDVSKCVKWWCKILVSPLNKQTNVAVVFTETEDKFENIVHGTLHDNGERYYDCSDAQTKASGMTYHTIFSNDDISVVVINKCIDEINSYRVYPFDTFDTEFMMLDYNEQDSTECSFVTEHEKVQYVSYYSISVPDNTRKDSQRNDFNLFSRMKTTAKNDISGSLIIFDKPSAVFCGKFFKEDNLANWFHQLLPVSVWSNEYMIPAFVNSSFKIELLVVSNADNTIVNITGGFDATHTIYNRGDKVTQDIDARSAYRINASQKIGVGLRIYDPSNETKSTSFHMLPPSKNLHDTVVTSYHNKIFETLVSDVKDVKTYFVDENLAPSTVSKGPDDYRHVHKKRNLFGMSVVTYDPGHWFVIPGNIKCKVLHMDGNVCNISFRGEDDNQDNDCDGLFDEDVCYNTYGVYREDKDLDGGFGEDCNETLTGPVVISKPKEPMCIEINKPPDQCWTVCTCKCSWVEKYEAMKHMSKEELEEAQQNETERIKKEMHIDKNALQSTTAKRRSARDKRKSAASIGYVGIGLFAVVFGMIFIMDISSLLRDARILLANLREGFERISECFKCFKRRREG